MASVVFSKTGGGTITFPNVESRGYAGSTEPFLQPPNKTFYHQAPPSPVPYKIKGKINAETLSTAWEANDRVSGTLDVESGDAVWTGFSQTSIFTTEAATVWYQYDATFLILQNKSW